MEIVQSMKTLRSMEKAGHIKLHPHTGEEVRSWFGITTAWYVDDVPSRFTFNGIDYKGTYVDGCFFPFVENLGKHVEVEASLFDA